jgi:hypothetical protein
LQNGEPPGPVASLNSVALTVYKIDYITVDEEPEVLFMCLKRLVGERGFEPPTPWSRTRFRGLLKSIEICSLQLVDIAPVAGCSLEAVEICWTGMLLQPQNRLHLFAFVKSRCTIRLC